MRRLVFLVLAVVLIGAAVFFADRPGHVAIVWQHWRIDTSVGVLVAAVIVAALAVAVLAALLGALWRTPRALLRRRRERRRRAGYRALTSGMVAVAAGDGAEARRHARRAEMLLAEPPLTLLLSAQAAQLNGDGLAAKTFFTTMLDRKETEFLGLRGLLNEALRADDRQTALRLAERARLLRPGSLWVVESLVDLQARNRQWEAARATLEDCRKRRLLPASRVRHHQGVILHELARAAEGRGDMHQAVKLAARAQGLVPELAALAATHVRLLASLGGLRAATKAGERAWRNAPHPDIAGTYGAIHRAEPPLERLRIFARLTAQFPEARESHLTMAEAALDARLWGEARQHLDEAARLAPATPRLCLLMARLEEATPGSEPGALPGAAGGAVRRWLDRAVTAAPDPCYVCAGCGAESREWQALCRQCGRFDTLAWQSPVRAVAAASPPPDRSPPPLPAGAAALPPGAARPVPGEPG